MPLLHGGRRLLPCKKAIIKTPVSVKFTDTGVLSYRIYSDSIWTYRFLPAIFHGNEPILSEIDNEA